MHILTAEDLVQYLYSETSPKKTASIKAALESDFSLRETFKLIVSAHERLNTVLFSPRDQVVKKILRYAKKTISKLHQH
jgi:hypothetical protein